MLKVFVDGMIRAGASVDTFYIPSMKIKPCQGDFSCWSTKPGQCHLEDDMQLLYPKLRNAEVLVLATPVYVPLPGEMQNLLNRLVPLLQPVCKWRRGRTRLIGFRPDVKITKVALVSTSGWWELGNFGTVVRIMREFAKDANVDFAGALLRPNFRYMAADEKRAKEIYGAAEQAGYQLVEEGRIAKELLSTISQPLISRESWLKEF